MGFGNQIGDIAIFRDNRGYSGSERLIFQGAAGVSGVQNDRNVRHDLLQRLRSLDAIHDGHGEIQYDQVRSQLLSLLNRLPPILRRSANGEPTRGEQTANGFSHYAAVIYDEDTAQHWHRVGPGQERTRPLEGRHWNRLRVQNTQGKETWVRCLYNTGNAVISAFPQRIPIEPITD